MGNPSLKDMVCPFCEERMTVHKNEGNDKYVLLCGNENCPFTVRTKKHYKSAYDAKSEYYKYQIGVEG